VVRDATSHSVRSMGGASRQRLYIEEHGAGEPLLLIEGLGQSMWAWREQIPVLARDYRTIAFDTRGTGRSPVPDERYGIDELAQDAADILDGRPAHVVGLSMGGYVALTLALAQSKLVRSLVLIGTGAGGPDRVPRPQEVRDAYAAAIGLPFDVYGRRTMPWTFSPGWTEQNPERFEEILVARSENPTPDETLDAHLEACYGFYGRGCDVERIDVPALVLHGDADVIVPVENGRALASRLPNARYVELPGRGHNVQLEDPETVNRLVLEFLSN
jgi:3-oxoadipate enol-lactonase